MILWGNSKNPNNRNNSNTNDMRAILLESEARADAREARIIAANTSTGDRVIAETTDKSIAVANSLLRANNKSSRFFTNEVIAANKNGEKRIIATTNNVGNALIACTHEVAEDLKVNFEVTADNLKESLGGLGITNAVSDELESDGDGEDEGEDGKVDEHDEEHDDEHEGEHE